MRHTFWSIACGLLLLGLSAYAQVTEISEFKVTVYNQTGPAAPTTPASPNAYYFGVTFTSDPDFTLTEPPVITVSDTTNSPLDLYQNGDDNYNFNSPYYADKTNFDSDYPNAAVYDYSVLYLDPNFTNTTDEEDLLVTVPADDLYTTVVPALTSSCWTAVQNVDPTQPVCLAWLPYEPLPEADYAYTFLDIFDQTGNSLYGQFNYEGPSDVTAVGIPAGTLEFGRTYSVSLYYSDRVTGTDFNDFGGSVDTIVGFDNLTQTTLVTIPPTLQICPSNQSVILTWPLQASDYVLQKTHDLAVGNWCNVAESPTATSSNFFLTLPECQSQIFFRLSPRVILVAASSSH